MLRTLLSHWCWGSALGAVQPHSSGHHLILFPLKLGTEFLLILVGAGPLNEEYSTGLDGAELLLPSSHYGVHGHHVPGAAPHQAAWELVGTACAVAQGRATRMGKWEAG